MTREINGRIRMVVSDDGTRCAAECPHVVRAVGQGDCDECAAFTDILSFSNGANVRLSACIAAEQAAASVPSCEGAKHVESLATLAMNAEKNLAYIHATFPGGDPRDMDWYAREVAALVWAHKAAQAAASTGHLDGGARALDASEALRDDDCDECDGCGVRTCGSGPMCGAPCGKCAGAGASAEALREARVQGMREGYSISRTYLPDTRTGYARADIEAAIEAVRKEER